MTTAVKGGAHHQLATVGFEPRPRPYQGRARAPFILY
jgi:hypothetical protein